MSDTPVVRRSWKPSLVAALLGVACSLALVFAFSLLAGALLPRVAFSPVLAVACAASVLVASGIARRAERGRSLRAASWALVGWAPYIFGGAAFDLSNPLVAGRWRCGTADVGLFFLAACSVPVVFALTTLCAVQADRVRVPRVTRLVAWLAVGVSALALTASLSRSHKLASEDYVASLPAVAEFSRDDDRFRGPWFTIEQRPPSESPGAVGGCTIFSIDHETDARAISPECQGTRVLRDALHGVWIFETPTAVGGRLYSAITDRSRIVQPVDVGVRTVASSLRPPTSWTVSLAVGCALGLALLGIARGIRTRADAWRSARRGAHGGGGWVTFEDGTPPGHFASAAALPVGAVLVLESSRKAPHYREHGRTDEGARIAEGSFEQIAERAEGRATDLHAFATLMAWLTVAPMLAAYLNGLLG